MSDMLTLDRAAQLFAGNPAAVGTEEGGCLRVDNWHAQLQHHFDIGCKHPIGVYPMWENKVIWGCVDYDEGDEKSWVHAVNTIKVLQLVAGITGWIERSRSKGYHVWVFANDWVPAIDMRRALLAAAQVVGAPMKEINPKQAELPADKLGNYVRLPYPKGPEAVGPRRVVVDEYNNALSFHDFIDRAWNNRCTQQQLLEMGERYKEPVKPKARSLAGVDTKVQWANRINDGLAYTMLFGHGKQSGGPYEGQDRSSWLWKLCNRLIEHSKLTDEEIVNVMIWAHDTWTPDKFEPHRLEEEMVRMTEKAMEQHQ